MSFCTARARHRVHYDTPEGTPGVALPGETFRLSLLDALALESRGAIVELVVEPDPEAEPKPKAKRAKAPAVVEVEAPAAPEGDGDQDLLI